MRKLERTYQVPNAGIPRAYTIVRTIWKKKTTKNNMKLKELSFLEEIKSLISLFGEYANVLSSKYG